ncbi:hypothetical protein ACFY30_21095 [Streptomyces sp. NPDC000345]|uniref:hypothetical protein n=1 Tax=Streptomyces sp. NPDC000345 TaxID=3364537 RepID=UPI0036BCBF23
MADGHIKNVWWEAVGETWEEFGHALCGSILLVAMDKPSSGPAAMTPEYCG